MKTQVVGYRVIVTILMMMSLIYGVQSVSYGQLDAPTVTPGETNTSLIIRFQITLDEGVDENAYQIQVRRKTPLGEWILKCVVIKYGSGRVAGDPDVFVSPKRIDLPWPWSWEASDKTFNIRAIFTDLEPGTTYEARYRDTNLPECAQNPTTPAPWSDIAEGTTHLVAPLRVEFVDVNLAGRIRYELGLDRVGGHIELLKIPEASLAKLTELELDDAEITDITGLEHATQLTDLDFSYNQISDITSLAQLTQLTDLDLSDNQISDITPLAQLTQLTELELDRNLISDISPLAGLPSLRWLPLHSNQISDVTLLPTFASLESLWYILLSGNPIVDTSPIRALKRGRPNLNISIDIPVILTDPGNGPDLYVLADGDSIFQLNLYRINVQEIGTKSSIHYDIAIDGIRSKIYWSRRNEIQRANLDGTNVQDVTRVGRSRGIAIDGIRGKIYWIESGSRIQRADLDGTNVQDVVAGVAGLNSITLDVASGKIYWIESGSRIQRANLDGTDVQDVVTGVAGLNSIALDVAGGKIYWIESGSRIQRANLDGSDVHDVVHDLDGPRGIALDIAGDKIYWTDYYSNEIWRANLDGSNVHVVAIGVSSPTAIALDSYYTELEEDGADSTIAEPPPVPEDVNRNDVVNILDLVLVAANLGDEGADLAADVNGDDVVNILDLVLVAGALGNAARRLRTREHWRC